jgi:hypothetical protein
MIKACQKSCNPQINLFIAAVLVDKSIGDNDINHTETEP